MAAIPASLQYMGQTKLKFSANLGWLFKNIDDYAERYAAAAKAGFQAVEAADLTHLPLEALVTAKKSANVNQVLLNSWPGRATDTRSKPLLLCLFH